MFLFQLVLATLVSAQLIQAGISVTLTADDDTSGSTLGLLNPSPPSHLRFDDKSGLRLEGSYADVLGPPVKIADGFRQLVTGSGMSGVGSSLQNNGAVLNFDSKLLEAAGLGSLIKGGVLLTGSTAKVNAANLVAGAPGKKIASVVEIPVKVMAMKDIAASKGFSELAHKTAQEAQRDRNKGAELVKSGNAMKHNGVQEILQGASEGVQNFGNIVQRTTNNAASAFRLLPILLDLPKPDQSSSSTQQQIEEPIGTKSSTGLASGPPNMFGNFNSFMHPGGNNGFFSGQNGEKLGSGLAAVLNITHPLASLLTNPGLNPFILPMSAAGAQMGGWNPIAQGLGNKQPIGLSGSSSLAGGGKTSQLIA